MSQLDQVSTGTVRLTHSEADDGSTDMHHRPAPNRIPPASKQPTRHREEALVVDERTELRPAQVVESKLSRMLKDASLPVSHLQMRGLLRSR
jgi:hypothetical protein